MPFSLDREPPAYRLRNMSSETVHGVTLALHGTGMFAANVPATLYAGEALEVTVREPARPHDSIVVVRWFRPSGVEYLWSITL